jgi:hypothetical protein
MRKYYIQIKNILIFVLIFITALTLASCRYDNTGAAPSGTPVPTETISPKAAAPTETVSPGAAAPTEAAPSDTASAEASSPGAEEPIVLFIGNSLTFMSRIPEKLKSIASSKNVSFDIRQITNGGYKLSQHLKDFKEHDYFNKSYISEADIVIFQEIGRYQSDTAEVITEFQELFGSGKQFYFLETEYHNIVGNKRDELKNIQFIRSGFAHDQLIYNGPLRYSDLHMHNDPHPNHLYGYVAAFTVYCEITGTSCSDFTAEEMYNLIGEDIIPGDTAEAKNDIVLEIQEAVNAALEDESAN